MYSNGSANRTKMKNSKYEKVKKLIRDKGICRNTIDSGIFTDLLINWQHIPKHELENLVEKHRKNW